MQKTTVYLDEETVIALRNIAVTQKRSQAEILREALTVYIKKTERKVGHRAIPGAGAYRSNRSDISENAEELLGQGFAKHR